MSTAAMQAVFNDLVDSYLSADKMRNFESGGLYRENNIASKQNADAFKSAFKVGADANDNAKMQSVFNEVLGRFKGADTMRNFLVSRQYHEDKLIQKQRVQTFVNRFAAAITAP
jgi:hypothetical protein